MNIKCNHFLINESCKECQKIKTQWYQKLEKKGFEDIEEANLDMLKRYSGVCEPFDVGILQESHCEVQSSWPEPNFQKEEEFLNHPEFKGICQNVFKHGNSISAKIAIQAWQDHCEGMSSREIAIKYKISPFSGWNIINKLKELMKIMNFSEPTEIVTIRAYNSETDLPFVYAAWKNSIWYDQNPGTSEKPDPMFSRLMTKKIKLILERPKISVKIACLKYTPDQIIGYAVLEDTTLEFVYIKVDYRKQGIGSILVKGFKEVINPLTKIGKSITKKKSLKIKENENGSSKGPKEEI